VGDDIEDYWEDIRFYPPEPPDPIIRLRAEEMARKAIAEELGVDVKDYIHIPFDRFIEAMRALRASRMEAALIRDLHERPVMLNEFQEAFRARRR
jgi:hypothetical protein